MCLKGETDIELEVLLAVTDFDNFVCLISQYMPPANLNLAYEGISLPLCHRDAVVNACVYVHLTLHQANTRVAKRGGRTMSITPRHYLDFIFHYVSSSCLCNLSKC